MRRTLFALLLLAGGLPALAATITVNSFLDNGVNCTLRKAIENANAGAQPNPACTAGSAGSNTIVLGTGTYLFTSNPNGPYNLLNNSITIQGNGPANTVIDGQNTDYIFDNFGTTAETAITITFTGLTITRGSSPGFTGFDVAGAVFIEYNATAFFNNVAFTNNTTTASGGAIATYGNTTINNATFTGNTGRNTSGIGEGGAIRNGGTLTVTNSTFVGNAASSGGAIYHTGDTALETLTITNSTFSGNNAGTRGGAIATNNPASLGAVTLNHVTIANNSAGSTGGGIYKNQTANFNLTRSIIADNTATTGPNCNANGAQSFNSQDYNVLGSTTGCTISGTTTNNFVGAALLNALASNGGSTQTISLQAYSPARDRAPTCAAGVTTDQRGTARPLGTQCDAGAYEAAPTVPQAPTIGTATPGSGQASVQFSANNSGGSAVLDYTATSNPGGFTGACTAPCTSITVSGLNNGTAYTFTVTARNSVGTSAASAASNSVTPTCPMTATITSSTNVFCKGNPTGSATVTASGGAGGYTYSWSPSGGSGATASGLLAGIYTVTVTDAAACTRTATATITEPPALVATQNQTNVFCNGANSGSAGVTASGGAFVYTYSWSPFGGTGATANNLTAGNYTVTITDANLCTLQKSFTITQPPAIVANTSGTNVTVRGSCNGTASVSSSGGTGSHTYSWAPSGGTAATATNRCPGTYTPTVTDANACTAVGAGVPINEPPSQPTGVTATAGNAQATVAFGTPSSNGGLAILFYRANCGGTTADGPGPSIIVGGLANGTPVTCTVTAHNAAGAGDVSAASNSVTPAGPPGAPTIGTATAGNAQASVTFSAPGSDGGAPISGYTVTSNPGGFVATGSSPVQVNGLANGTAYTFTVTATNSAGTGPSSAPSNSVTPSTVPGAPIIGPATAGNAQASVTFSAPGSDGGAPITGYTATSSPGSFSGNCTAPCTSIPVTGLANGTAYSFTVRAVNTNGPGAPSASSNTVTPATIPGAPVIGTATGGNAQASVTFAAPASDGGAAITSFTATSSPGGFTGACTAPCTAILVAGLANGTAYTFTVTATNGIGSGPASSASNSVTPSTVPGAPTIGTATAGNTQASVTFAAPVSDGGAAITGYAATSSPGGFTGTCTVPCTSITVTGLANGTAYSFTVRATNANGPGVASASSNPVTPIAVPGAPAMGTATAGNAQASITFTAPASDGGSPIASYTATSSPGAITGSCNAPCASITVMGLANGTPYTFTVAATNAAGTGPGSAPSNSVTPSTVPGAPTGVSALPGDGQATISFSAPASDGGSPITGYGVSCTPGPVTFPGASSPIIVAGLTNGVPYACQVAATNAVGTGPGSSPVAVTPAAAMQTLTVQKAGAGAGTITSVPAGVDCGATCSASFASGATVTLAATAASGSVFTGWSGACSGVAACAVTMDAAKTVTASFDSPPRLANISSRVQVLTGDDVLIGGFIIGGTAPKTVVVRARGPSMAAFGVTGLLANPQVQLFSGPTVIAGNDDWQQAANAAALQASGFAPSDAQEAAILTTLAPGAYTAIVTGVAGGTGLAIVEVFEVDAPEVPLLNIATRGRVGTGDSVMIAGIIVQGSGPQSVVIRARGPSLAAFGLNGLLPDPMLQLFNGPTLIATNDDWQQAASSADILASGFAPSDPRESAILITLDPGAYTAIVSGPGGTGLAIVEVFAR